MTRAKNTTRENKEYGGSDGDNGFGGKNGCTQNGETKETLGEITSTGNFGTYRSMCGFGGGECRSVIRTLREKCKYNITDLITYNK